MFVSLRDDQGQADELLGTSVANRHTFKGNFVWDLPDMSGGSGAKNVLPKIVNDWQLSGVWTASTGTALRRRLQLPERGRET